MCKRKSKEEFINEAIKIHGDKYDYPLVEYINSKILIKIRCKKHELLFSIIVAIFDEK